MNGIGVLAFGVAAAVIAVASRPPKDNTPPPPYTLRDDGVSITAMKRDVDVGGKMEPHLILVTTGRGSGSVSVRFEVNESLRQARMPNPYAEWEKTITLDQDGGRRETDLGELPEQVDFGPDSPGVSRQLLATTDDKSYVMLWTESPQIDELIKQSGFEVKHRGGRR